MTTNTQQAHYSYTFNEWNDEKHKKAMDIVFKNNDIRYVFDIGANVGCVTKILLSRYPCIEKVYCFEMEKENIDYLSNTVLREEIANGKVVLIPKGVYYGKTSAKIYSMGYVGTPGLYRNVGGYSIDECCEAIKDLRNLRGEKLFCGWDDSKTCELDTLENLLYQSVKDLVVPDFCKIDVEGAEKNILENSKLVKQSKYLYVEWNHHNTDIFTILPDFKSIPGEYGDILLKKIC